MGPQTSLDRQLPRQTILLWTLVLVLVSLAPVFCQQPTHTVSVLHPGGLTRLELEYPALTITGDDWMYYPAGRFQLWTGTAAPIGGDPTRTGDESRNIASVAQGGSFTSKTTIAINPRQAEDVEDDEDLGYFYDIHELMASQDPQESSAALTNYWIAAPVAGTRDLTGIYRLPVAFDEDDLPTAWIEVRQALTLIGDALQAEYIVYNTTPQQQRIGVRIVFDGIFGGAAVQDGQAIILPDGTAITRETKLPDTTFGGQLLPDTWVTYDDPMAPTVAIRGVINAQEVLDAGPASKSAGLPDSVAWGQMRNMGLSSQYYFTPNPQALLLGEDWGYAVKWDPEEISPGQSCRFVTYYGVGMSTPDYDRPYAFLVYTPPSLIQQTGDDPATPDVVEDYYLGDSEGRSPFPIAAYIDNYGAEALLDASVRIRLPIGLELMEGESPTKSVGVVRRNELKWVSWMIRATAARPGRHSVKFTGPQGKVLERLINIPAVPVLNPLESPRGLEMVSIPYEFGNTDAEWVFQDLGSLQPGGNATIVRWDPHTGQYRWFPDPSTTNIEPGVGFWLLNLTRESVELPLDAVPVSTERTYSIRLPAGWNQIGNPFTIPLRLDQARVIGPAGGEYSIWEAYSRLLLVPTIFEYDPLANDYVWSTELSEARLDPYKGYWLLCYDDITLQFPPPSLFSPATVAAQEPVTAAAPDRDRWAVKLSVTAGEQVRTNRAFGTCPGAKDGYDRNDMPQPPVAVAEGARALNAGFLCGDAPADEAGRLLVDMRPPAPNTTWRFAVSTGVADQDVTVSWDDLAPMGGDLVPTLVDTATGRRCYMRTASSYTYRTRQDHETRVFELIVRQRGPNTLMVTSLSAQQARGGQVPITYSLTVPANVDIVIRNISGVPVARVAANRMSPEGTNSVVWAGQNQKGAPVPSGCYICHITARCPETGQVANVLRTFNISP